MVTNHRRTPLQLTGTRNVPNKPDKRRRYRRTLFEDEVNADLLATPVDHDDFWGHVGNYGLVCATARHAAL